jgi:hypothetical protein
MPSKKIYVPKGKDILTTNGCTCKNEYKDDSGKTIKNSCTAEGSSDEPWCVVKGKCGAKGRNSEIRPHVRWYDNCTLTGQAAGVGDIVYGKDYFDQNMKGIIVYIVIFVIAIPIILYRFKFYGFLEVYMPNFDLLATAVSFGGGPGDTRIFQELYNKNSNNLLGQTSMLFINYLSLLGLTYLVARQVKISKSIAKGWGMGFIMLFFTYLVPNGIISYIQKKFAAIFLDLKFDFTATLTEYLIVVVLGLGVAGGFILVERAILDEKRLHMPFIKRLLNIGNALDKLFNM